jgi:rRNA maturation RNase YbeY
MGKISFFKVDCKYRLSHRKQIDEWLKSSVSMEGWEMGKVHIVLCSDEYLLTLNQKFLKHNTYTDIITFQGDREGFVEGELYISLERIKENAGKFSVSVGEELNRVLIHGFLHLMGYKDKAKKEKEVMKRKEDYYLELLKCST